MNESPERRQFVFRIIFPAATGHRKSNARKQMTGRKYLMAIGLFLYIRKYRH